MKQAGPQTGQIEECIIRNHYKIQEVRRFARLLRWNLWRLKPQEMRAVRMGFQKSIMVWLSLFSPISFEDYLLSDRIEFSPYY